MKVLIKKEVVWLKFDPKTQIPHLKTLLKSHKFHQSNKGNGSEILQEYASISDVTNQKLSHLDLGTIENPIVLKDDDTGSNDNALADVQMNILSSKPLPENLSNYR